MLENDLISSRNIVLEKTLEVFKGKAVECHISGSLARGDSDAYSDIDIWFIVRVIPGFYLIKNKNRTSA